MSVLSIRKSQWQAEMVTQFEEVAYLPLATAPALTRLRERIRKRPQQIDPGKLRAKRAYHNGFYEDEVDQQWPIHSEILDISGSIQSSLKCSM
jgi:hypothetical protein